ncbi:Pyruvate/Phosphoenolpyruvate kinase-like domain-containing protein [Auriculariales sp. MPI-PUGE-AT-0066]|nr:Pyruvate/Phosphoenolpyruvate kinase-like domain-containing protein [Auriculariales sp. MPI-PUGE-AT-0066]
MVAKPNSVREDHETYGWLSQPNRHPQAPFRAAQITYPANLREALRQAQEDPRKTLFGVAHGIPSVFVTKILASTKPDFVWIDVEHGMFDRLTLHDAIHAAMTHSEGRAIVIVRVPKNDEISLTTALDAGAAGIVMPHTESAEEVREMMKAMYFPPMGQRSFSPWTFTPGISDASLYPEDPFNIRTSNQHVCLIPQIESVRGIENAEEIASVPGVSALMFGFGDFMIDAGVPVKLGGEPHPKVAAAIGRFMAAAKSNGLPLFGGAQTPDMVPSMVGMGYAAIAIAFDYWGLARLVHDGLVQARKSVAGEDAAEEGGKTQVATNGHGAREEA